ncbi:MAG TPA: hypothetical protein VF774_11800 [Pseudoduganella sp.]|jgi:hypothetical protein
MNNTGTAGQSLAERAMRGRAIALIAICLAGGASAQDMHQHGHEDKAINQSLPAAFMASNDRPFAQMMNEAMAIMDRDMQALP